MTINGYEVSPEILRAANLFCNRPQFRATELEECLIARGVPKRKHIANRAADRILQAARKRGEIKFNGKTWERVQ